MVATLVSGAVFLLFLFAVMQFALLWIGQGGLPRLAAVGARRQGKSSRSEMACGFDRPLPRPQKGALDEGEDHSSQDESACEKFEHGRPLIVWSWHSRRGP